MRRGLLNRHSDVINLIHRSLDWLVIITCGLIVFAIYPGQWPLSKFYISALAVAAILVYTIFPYFSLYQAWRGASLFEEIRTLSFAWLVVVLLMLGISVLTKSSEEYSRIWLVGWSVSTWIVLIISRVIARNALGWMREKGLNIRNIVLVGNNKLSEEIAAKFKKEIWAGFNLKGVFIKDFDPEDTVVGHPVLGGIKNMAQYVEENNIDQVWIVMPLKEEEAVMRILNELRLSTVDIRYVPDIFGLNLFNHSITEVIGYPVINLSVSPMVGMNKFVKVIEDGILALIIFIVFFPIMLIIGILVKVTSKGPMLFKQKRHGWDGRVINVYKFRTMHLHAENGGIVTQAMSDDHRVTRLGKFLRRTSMDELPQVYNVLQGRMSLVGPRPHAIEHNLDYREKIDQYMLRHKVKPGITGWAQVNGYRGETNTIDKMKKRVEYDIYYIENWSLWLDLKILFLTIFKGFTHKNAY